MIYARLLLMEILFFLGALFFESEVLFSAEKKIAANGMVGDRERRIDVLNAHWTSCLPVYCTTRQAIHYLAECKCAFNFLRLQVIFKSLNR